MRTPIFLLFLSYTCLVLFGCKKDEEQAPCPQGCGGAVTANTVIDMDGNVYLTVTIGAQVWMKENLRTIRYRDGSMIPYIADNIAWGIEPIGACCYYSNLFDYNLIFGKLYNWHAANDTRGLCPVGWRLPSDADWQELESALGMPSAELDGTGYRGVQTNVGMQMKAPTSWQGVATEEWGQSGFSALAGGHRAGGFFNLGITGSWWSSTEATPSSLARARELRFDNTGIRRFNFSKENGCCVRCLKD